MRPPLDALREATRLTRLGQLAQATRVIQRALGGGTAESANATAPEDDAAPGDAGQPTTVLPADVEDVAFRDLPAGVVPATDVQAPELPATPPAPDPSETAAPPTQAPRAHRAAHAQGPGEFRRHQFRFGGHRYSYRLYLPAPPTEPAVAASGLPVLVMLHGCKQDSEDFARGTAMNALAQRHGCIVVYPEQLRSANNMGCWNWFEPAHQQRGAGEPAFIAELTRAVVSAYGADPSRVYVAGLSAGGAMAALVAQLYPDVFAAAGVHSGIAPGAAHDLVSAFGAMRKARGRPGKQEAVPTIVFHGSGDTTVHPSNARQIVQGLLAGFEHDGNQLLEAKELRQDGGRKAEITRYAQPDGTVLVEHWEVATGPHAWSGGDRAGSFTDPQGPSASEAMLAFFLRHRLTSPG